MVHMQATARLSSAHARQGHLRLRRHKDPDLGNARPGPKLGQPFPGPTQPAVPSSRPHPTPPRPI